MKPTNVILCDRRDSLRAILCLFACSFFLGTAFAQEATFSGASAQAAYASPKITEELRQQLVHKIRPLAVSADPRKEIESNELDNEYIEVFLHFREHPTVQQLSQLENFGVRLGRSSWVTSSLPNYTGFMFARLPIAAVPSVIQQRFVESLSSGLAIVSQTRSDREQILQSQDLNPYKHPRMDAILLQLQTVSKERNLGEAEKWGMEYGLKVRGGKVNVEIKSNSDTPLPLSEISKWGGFVDGTWKGSHSAWLPIAQLTTIAETLQKQYYVAKPLEPAPDPVDSEALAATGADYYHARSEDGTGVVIGLIDQEFFGLTAAVTNGDAPDANRTDVNYSGQDLEAGDANTDHGTNCLEVLFDMAPGATYRIYKIGNTVHLGQAVTDGLANGVNIFSHSLSWFNTGWHDDTGDACAAANIASANNTIFVTSAGNRAQQHWQGGFNDNDNDNRHEWQGGDEFNRITVPNGARFSLHIQWDTDGADVDDYDLFVYTDDQGNNQISPTPNSGQNYESVALTNNSGQTRDYWFAANQVSGNGQFEIFVAPYNCEYFISNNSATSPSNAMGVNVISVAAVHVANFQDTNPAIMTYSSQGPTNDGNQTPDITGPTNVSTFSDGTFGGTSCATPNVAGAAAVRWSFEVSPTANTVRTYLYNQALLHRDWGVTGVDPVFGNGGLILSSPIAVTEKHFDDIQSVLDGLGSFYAYTNVTNADLANPNFNLNDYDIIFINCSGSADLNAANAAGRLRDWVNNGGQLYASDWAYSYVAQAFPGYVTFPANPKVGTAQTVNADILDSGLAAKLGGNTIALNYDLGAWVAIDNVASDVTVHLFGTYETSGSSNTAANGHVRSHERPSSNGSISPASSADTKSGPLLVSFSSGNGNVIFTTFHNEAQQSEKEKELLEYLVLKPATEDLTAQAIQQLSPGMQVGPTIIDAINEGETKSFQFINDLSSQLEVVLNWSGSEMKLEIIQPEGSLYDIYQSQNPPMKATITNAVTGTWQYKATAIDVPFDNYPFVIVTGYQPSALSVLSVSPNSASPGQNLNVTISGINFASGATVSFSGSGITVNSTSFINSTQLNASISIASNASAGPRDVIVTNPNGQSATAPGLFMVTGCASTIVVDNFSDNNFDGWLPRVFSNWAVEPVNGNPAFCMTSGNPNGDEYSLLTTGRWQDFTLELKARSSAGGNKNFFVIFGVQNFPNSTAEGYYLRFTPGTVDLFRSIAGNPVVLASTSGDYVSDNNYHALRIERTGQNIRVLVDAQLLFSPNDATFTSGFIGFGSYQSTACFDDVSMNGCLLNTGVVGPLAFVSYLIDDNIGGNSNGNGNGLAEGGERVELVVAIKNQGGQTANGVTALLATSDVDAVIFDNGNLWPNIPAGVTLESSSNFGFEVNADLAQQKSASFTLTTSAANGGPWSSSFSIPLYPDANATPADLVGKRVYLRTSPGSGNEVNNPVAGQQYYVHFDWTNAGDFSALGFRYALFFNDTEICGVSGINASGGVSRTVWCDNAITWPAAGGVIEGALDVHSHLTEPAENNNTASRVFGFQNFVDFDFTAQVRSTENLNNNGGADFCFVYGYQDERHYYYVMFNRGQNETRVYKVRESERLQIGNLGAFVIPDENYHTVRLRRAGSTLEVFWDGTRLGAATDGEYGGGGMGLGSLNDASIFDEICLKPGASNTCAVFDNFEDGVAEGWLPLHASRWDIVADGGDRGYRINETNYPELDYLRLGEYSLIGGSAPQQQAELAATRLYLRTGQNSGPEIDNPVAGQSYFIHLDWQNTGTVAANDFRTEIKLDNNLLCGQTESANAGATETMVCASPVTFTAGTHVLQAALDANSIIPEANENNNAISRTFNVTSVCDPTACSGPAIFPAGAGATNPGVPITGRDGSTICIDIRLRQNTEALNAFGFQVKVDPAHLAFTSFTAGDLTQNFITKDAQENPPGSGIIICGGFGTNAIPVNSTGVLLHLCFTVTCNAGENSKIEITNLTDDVSGLAGCCNLFTCTSCSRDGDVNGDFTLTPGDAFCAFRIYLNGGNLPTDCDEPNFDCEVTAADPNCDGAVTPGDAFEIFNRYLQGGTPEDCFAQSGTAKASARTGPYRLAWQARMVLPTPESNLPEVMKVAMNTDNPQGLQAWGMRFNYPGDKLEFAGIERTALTADWVKLEGAAIAEGEVLIGGFHTQPIATRQAGELFNLLFVVKDGARAGHAVLASDFFASDFVDDLRRAEVQTSGPGSVALSSAPNTFMLYQNYPNPFPAKSTIAQTLIRFDLPGTQPEKVELAIYNIAGQIIRRLLSASRSPGAYEVIWDGKDELGQWAPSGTYWYRLQAGDFSASKQLTVLR